MFSDGRVAVRWLTVKRSVSVWDCYEDMDAIHGYPEYGTKVVWHDDSGPADEADHQGSGADHGGRAGSSANEGSIPSAVTSADWERIAELERELELRKDYLEVAERHHAHATDVEEENERLEQRNAELLASIKFAVGPEGRIEDLERLLTDD